ncbi:DNA-binding protein [Fibrobacter succinogenes subsp. succinogenes S85]|uniref:DNA-binding protein n=1 Tax=Fibrobacter succinogenes (strain ATCC 19169 / S85) TaxID=59374 RepID=C9RR39_FIBSS|nr:helix-turn-helix transcriptional regulator [Fibrobacter succinogenes]ACX75025.1 helix-turn-helix domain protein [Fibrobacter succinogenes subsp. succinogenes S85]ADL27366.1 DNA-binding protein [Fibrobacter succinogenes subsp. succinogenes S85]
MRYDIDVIRKAEIELLAQMQGATSITKKKLALDSGISRQHLGLVAKGKRNLSVKSFCDLADAFGCTATELMSKLEALMLEQIQLQTPAAADKAKGINYINKAILDKNNPKKNA